MLNVRFLNCGVQDYWANTSPRSGCGPAIANARIWPVNCPKKTAWRMPTALAALKTGRLPCGRDVHETRILNILRKGSAAPQSSWSPTVNTEYIGSSLNPSFLNRPMPTFSVPAIAAGVSL